VNTLELQERITKSKGASVFAITSNVEKDSDGVPTIVSRLAISVKRKLVIHSWHDAVLVETLVYTADGPVLKD
jgi:Vam6/Vps39-like protein vacuolar protein sorting-associated protein 39